MKKHERSKRKGMKEKKSRISQTKYPNTIQLDKFNYTQRFSRISTYIFPLISGHTRSHLSFHSFMPFIYNIIYISFFLSISFSLAASGRKIQIWFSLTSIIIFLFFAAFFCLLQNIVAQWQQ